MSTINPNRNQMSKASLLKEDEDKSEVENESNEGENS